MADNEAGEDQGLSRLGSFMDCVFSIAITLPIVQLTPPTVGPGLDLAGAYRQLAPQFVAYLLDFAVIGLFWNYSHFGSKLLKRTDHEFNLLTLVFLACVSLTPVPSRPWVDHARDPASMHVVNAYESCRLRSTNCSKGAVGFCGHGKAVWSTEVMH